MIRNYIKTAWRNLIRSKGFSIINIMGLALGLACSLIIMLWVNDEKSVDAFHANKKYLYQVYERNYFDGKVDASYPTQGLLAEELKRTVPQIQYASGFEYVSAPGSGSTFEAGTKIAKMNGMFAGEDFLKMNDGLILKVPSAIVPQEHNFLINPLHKDFKKVKIVDRELLELDKRLLQTE